MRKTGSGNLNNIDHIDEKKLNLYVKNKTKLEHQCRKNDECINYCAIFHSIQ